nr:MAG TPA: hypothetical protein [Caudoviricetes sp.]DAV43385.1 MAG TPA: hypothetical protein [Caudoviricetes sp.]DAZ42237.1 MAG TPA: hypothetical protein [Caudoviricetes sp.]DAZ61375.1 MAG TPA: hypothetical protein [Caudoviricetes sp.]
MYVVQAAITANFNVRLVNLRIISLFGELIKSKRFHRY